MMLSLCSRVSDAARPCSWASSGMGRGLADDAGFWPVISRPSLTTCGCQSAPLLYSPPLVDQHVLDQEGHDVGQLHRLFFGVGEAGDLLALDQRRAVGRRARGAARRARGRRPRPACRRRASLRSARSTACLRPGPTAGRGRRGRTRRRSPRPSRSASLRVCGQRRLRGASALKRRVASVCASGSSLFGSSGGWPPLGEASVMSAPASLNT